MRGTHGALGSSRVQALDLDFTGCTLADATRLFAGPGCSAVDFLPYLAGLSVVDGTAYDGAHTQGEGLPLAAPFPPVLAPFTAL